MQGTLKSVKVLETFSDSTLDNSDLSNVGFWPGAPFHYCSQKQSLAGLLQALIDSFFGGHDDRLNPPPLADVAENS